MDPVLDAVEAGHQQRRISEIGIGHRVGEAELDALRLLAGAVGDAAGGRAVAARIGEQHRRLEARDQPLVAVGRRVGEGVERPGVLDHAADEIERHLAEAGIAVAGEQRLAALPDRHVGVHAAAVILGDRLGHEGRGLAVGMGDHVHDIFVDLHAVGGLDQRAVGQAELVLRGGDLVVVLVARQAHLEHRRDHLAADVARRCRPARPGNSRPWRAAGGRGCRRHIRGRCWSAARCRRC